MMFSKCQCIDEKRTQFSIYLNRRSMEDDSSAIENRFACIVGWTEVSLIRFSLVELNGLPLNTGLKRSIIEISSSVMHGASIKLKLQQKGKYHFIPDITTQSKIQIGELTLIQFLVLHK